jgi:2-C-methyl-D-erythritol 4-phosphate cytidylyltransferase
MRKFAIIVAAGSGTRMGNETPKQFLLLRGKPILYYSLRAFLDAYDDLEIILVLPEAHIEAGKEIAQSTGAQQRIQFTSGGDTRYQSVKNGLSLVKHPSIVFVHDGVRCMVSQELIRRCYITAAEKGNAIPAVTAAESIRIESTDKNESIDRRQVKIIQTPQTFHSELLRAAFEQNYEENFTDEAAVVEKSGIRIHLVEGDLSNIKITLPADLLLAEHLLPS